MEDILLEPVNYYKRQKGKNIRKILGDLFGKLLGVSSSNIELVNNLINDFHNASLVIDDIEDNGALRRNEPCAHLKYGIPLSMNAGYYSIFKTLMQITQNFSQQTSNKIVSYLHYLHEGQGMDIYYTQNKVIPSLEEYEKMMVYKTGYAFIMNLELLMDKSTNVIFRKNYEKVKHILILFSLFFQIRDDYINLTDLEYWNSKGFCQDFDEEKISYLITYFHNENINNPSTNPNISNINIIEMMKDKSKEGKIKIIQIFHDAGLFDTIYNKLLQLKQAILSEMNLEFIFDQLPFHTFNINDIDKF
jgi:geranylgeranyl diphosphate synthase type 3